MIDGTVVISRPFGYLFPTYWIESSTRSFVTTILVIGLTATALGAIVAAILHRLRETTAATFANVVANSALALGLLIFTYLLFPPFRCVRHAPLYIELTLAVACYLPASEVNTGKARRSYLLLALIWFVVVIFAADQVRYWGGMGRVSFLDLALAGAVFAPVALALAFAKRS
jgi:hypothetical protein